MAKICSDIMAHNLCGSRIKNYKTNWILLSFFRILLEGGASRHILTDQGERPIDLVDPGDARMIQVMLSPLEKKRWKKCFVKQKINQFHHITPYFWSSTRRSPLTYADLIVSVFVACGDFTKENTQNNWKIEQFQYFITPRILIEKGSI